MARARPRIAVVGPGRMGVGIAQALALAGYPVDLVDAKPRAGGESRSALARAEREVQVGLTLLESIGYVREDGSAALRLVAYHDVDAADDVLSRSRVIFEAVPETAGAKDAVYARIAQAAPAGALIGSTTSTFDANALAALVREPARFMNTHWLNPAPLMPLVEVAPATATSEDALVEMTRLLEDAGKVPVRCAPSAGYIVPRIQALAMNEAARLVEEGVADPAAVDTASRLGLGIRFATMGLLEFVDWGGADVLFYASEHLGGALGSDRFAAPEIVAEKARR